MVQIRNVPSDLHAKLKSRAALEGMTLSDYLLREIAEIASRPTRREMLERLRTREAQTPAVSIAELIREERDSRW